MIQEIVPWSERGSATASNIFARNLGSTLGATVLGAVLNFGLSRSDKTISSDQLRQLLEAQDKDGGTSGILLVLQDALHLTFGAMLLLSIVIVFMAALVPPISIRRS